MGGPLVMTRRKVSVLSSVRAALEGIGKEGTPMGAAALVLAGRLDVNEDPGSAMAAMSKELRTMMVELTKTAAAVNDPVDELRQRRKARLGA